jgi:hypothetical protein
MGSTMDAAVKENVEFVANRINDFRQLVKGAA